jgi:hypothetical protein
MRTYPNTPAGAGMKMSDAIHAATKGNLYQQATSGFQNIGRQIRKNVQAGQASPKSTQANFSINPLKGTGKVFVGSFKKGGKIKKTGMAHVHKGEMVVPKKSVKGKSLSQIKKSLRKTMGY